MPRRAPIDPVLERLARAVEAAERRGVRALTDAQVAELPRLYRYAATRLSQAETSGRDPAQTAALRSLLARAHAQLLRDLERHERGVLARAADFLLAEVPRAIRAEWRPIALSFAVVYGLAALSFVAVRQDLDVAWSLFDAGAISREISQLEATAEGEPFRGNFTFDVNASSATSGFIMAHNMQVGVLFFASALVPPLYAYLLVVNGLMLGTYTAVAAHWNQGMEISSILWCHGTLEIQALVLAGAAGLVLVRGILLPGPWTRRTALRRGAARSWRLLAPVFPLLFCAGLIEGYVSPHAPTSVRLLVAAVTGVVLVAWALLGGRGQRAARAGGPAVAAR